MPIMKATTISIAVGQEFLLKGFIDEEGNGRILLDSDLDLVFEKWSKLSPSSVNNMFQDAKVSLGGGDMWIAF